MKTISVNEFKKCYNKKLDGTWEWAIIIWFGPQCFADCVIKSPEGRIFHSQEEADISMNKVLTSFGIE